VRRVFTLYVVVAATAAVLAGGSQTATSPYFPVKGPWQHKDPAALGLDKARLDEAVALAVARQSTSDKDLAAATVAQFASEAP